MKNLSLLILFTLALACSTAPPKNSMPVSNSTNGAQVLFFEDHELPLVSIGWVIKSGAVDDPMSFSGLSNLTLSLWGDQPKLEEELKALGGSVSRQLTHDFAIIKLTSLSDQKDKLLSIAMKYLKSPSFDEKKFNQKKSLVISQLESDVDDAAMLASLQFNKEIYGGHPYGRRVSGNLREIQNITFDQIQKRFQDWVYIPNMVFFAAGDLDETFKKNLSSQLESMSGGQVHRNYFPKLVMAKTREIKIYDKPDSNQSFIYMGHPSLSRADEDYRAMEIATLILGNLSTSRLGTRIRQEKGLTYGIQSIMDVEAKAGHFEVSSAAKNENVGVLISESINIINEFVKNGITSEELETAKNYYMSAYLRETETVFDQAVFAITQELYGLPRESVEQSISKINSLSVSQVNDAIRRNIHPDQLMIMVLGPQNKILPQVKDLGIVELKTISDL